MFADDAKLYNNTSVANNVDFLCTDFYSIANWMGTWHLKLSVQKCIVLHIGPDFLFFNFNCMYNSVALKHVVSARDLGVTISNDLSFSNHCLNLFKRAMRNVNLIFKAFSCRDTTFLKSMYVTYVRCILEYCTCVWSPSNITDINLIERVQHNFTSRIPAFKHLPYLDRLKILDLCTLEYRRIVFDLCFLYRILFNDLKCSFSDVFVFMNNNVRDSDIRLRVPIARHKFSHFSFVNRVIRYWNVLPSDVRRCQSSPVV